MAEVLTIIGAIASCDQLLKGFTSLHKNLRKAYKTIRYARNDVENMKNRTWIIIRLWRFFRKCIKKVSKIKELSPNFEKYMNINQSLENQAKEVNYKISTILKDLNPLWTSEPVPAWKELYARLAWFMRNQEDIRLLYADMDLLIQYMKVYILLVQLQISVQQYNLSSSAATKLQVDLLGKMIRTGIRELRQIQQSQHTIRSNERPVMSNKEKDLLLQEIRTVVQQEISHLPRRDTSQNHSTSDPLSRSTQPLTSPSNFHTSSPSTPIQPDETLDSSGTNSTEASSEPQVNTSNSRGLSNNNLPGARQPDPFYPSSAVSYVSEQVQVLPMELNNSGSRFLEQETEYITETGREGEEDEQERGNAVRGEGIYVATALSGAPGTRHHQVRRDQSAQDM